jgi:serine/threonine protein kinase
VASTLEPPPLPAQPSGAPHFPGFRVIERLGTGGMGVVWLALQERPMREVAIKVMREDLDGTRVLERFALELDALAAMEHPHIARIHTGGRLEDGRPYFVMEHVDGVGLDRLVAERRPSLDERLDLFLKVCDAVAHAHRRGILHRDLKPGNVLVTERDGETVPKLIDFGIARAIGRAPRRSSVDGTLLGTPISMSPEQTIPGAGSSVRTDVYGLGVILYELLAGQELFSDVPRRGRSLDTVLRLVRTHVPAPPSALAGVSPSRLDAIALKALAKDPTLRHASVEALAEEVRGYRGAGAASEGRWHELKRLVASFYSRLRPR